MKFMVKYLSVAICILYCFPGCKKDNTMGFTSYLRGRIDGVGFECTSNIKANEPEPGASGGGSDPTIIITGEWPMYTIKLNIYGEGSSITTGSYVFQGGKNRSATIWQNNVDAYYAGNGGFFDPVSLYGSGRITILEISKSYIRGTFDFITAVNGVTGMSKTVTGGEFYIKRS